MYFKITSSKFIFVCFAINPDAKKPEQTQAQHFPDLNKQLNVNNTHKNATSNKHNV